MNTTKNSIKKIATSVALYGSLAAVGALSGQMLGRAITGHSFVAHATNQATATVTDAPSTGTVQPPEEIGPCNCPLCCHPI